MKDNSAVYEAMKPAEAKLEAAWGILRRIRAEAEPDALKAYGGNDYPRHLSLAITALEEAFLWAGVMLPDTEDGK